MLRYVQEGVEKDDSRSSSPPKVSTVPSLRALPLTALVCDICFLHHVQEHLLKRSIECCLSPEISSSSLYARYFCALDVQGDPGDRFPAGA